MGNYLKVIGIGVVVFCIMVGLGITASYIGYQKADHIYYEQIAGIVGKVVEQNPESEVLIAQSLKQIEAKDIARGKEILKPYGYEDKFLVLVHNKKGFKSLVEANILVMTILFGTIDKTEAVTAGAQREEKISHPSFLTWFMYQVGEH